MTGIVLQFVSLVCYANEYLMNNKLPENFYPENPAFKFCNSVQFFDISKESSPTSATTTPLAEDPIKWMEYLKEKGCKKLRLYFQYSDKDNRPPDYKTAAMVGGGGFWRMEARYENYCEVWASRWKVTQQDDPQRNIWSVEYALLSLQQEPTHMPCDLAVIKNVSLERFAAISAFARDHQLENWHKIFEKAYETLNKNEPPQNSFHKQMIPLNNYSLTARQLLFAAENAWVFGAMGSWNDLSFQKEEDNQLYEHLSYQLYDNLCVNILAAVNSY